MPNWHLCISAASERQRRNLGIGVGERVFRCDVAHRLRIGHSDPIVIRMPSRISKHARPVPSITSLLDNAVTARAAAPQYGQALPVSRHGTQELPICLEWIGFAHIESVRDRDLQLVEQKRLVFDQQAFCTTQTTRRMRDYGAYLGVSRNDSGGIHHYVKLVLLDSYGLHLDLGVQWLRSNPHEPA
jgi:hypothetical protein